jgi:hypothetical protein
MSYVILKNKILIIHQLNSKQMEPKKIKKLVLKRETIVNLSDPDQNNLRGGTFPDTGVIYGLFGEETCPRNFCYSPPYRDTNVLEGGACYTRDYEVSSCERCP